MPPSGSWDEVASVGAVLIDGDDVELFGFELSGPQRDSFQAETTKVITVLEALPVALAARVWSDRMKHRRVVFFIDNDAARAGLIKMTSDVPSIRRVQLDLVASWSTTPCFPWSSRVPSASNLGDSISRLQPLPILADVAKEVFPDMHDIFEMGVEEKINSERRRNEKRKRSDGSGHLRWG